LDVTGAPGVNEYPGATRYAIECEVLLPEQVFLAHIERTGETHEHLGAGHHLVPLVLAQRLGRNAVVELRLQVAK